MSRPIELVRHNPDWRKQGWAEALRIAEALKPIFAAATHIGSTAIPNILAKPVIDLLIEVTDVSQVDQFNEDLKRLGYVPKGENGIPGRRYFVKRAGELHTHHVHIYQRCHPEADRLVNFWRYLIAFPDEAQAYSKLKEQLAAQFTDDSVGYTDGKTAFVRRIDGLAKSWREGREIEDWR